MSYQKRCYDRQRNFNKNIGAQAEIDAERQGVRMLSDAEHTARINAQRELYSRARYNYLLDKFLKKKQENIAKDLASLASIHSAKLACRKAKPSHEARSSHEAKPTRNSKSSCCTTTLRYADYVVNNRSDRDCNKRDCNDMCVAFGIRRKQSGRKQSGRKQSRRKQSRRKQSRRKQSGRKGTRRRHQ